MAVLIAEQESMKSLQRGFTLMEMMVVLAIIAILALMTVPSYMDRIVRQQIEAALPLAEIAKKPVADSWAQLHAFPGDNAAAGLPAEEKIVSNHVSSSNTTVAMTSFPAIHGGTKFRARSQRGSYFTTNVKCTTATLMDMALGYVHRRNCYGKQSKDTAHQKCTCSYRG